MNIKNSLSVVAFSCITLFSASAIAQPIYDADAALADFSKRTSISRGDAAMWATAINSLMGTYVVKDGNTFKIVGRGKAVITTPPQVDLKDRPVYQQWVMGTQNVDASILAFFNFKQDKDSLTELKIKDIFSVTGSMDNDACAINRPNSFSPTTRYWCINAITLTSIETKTYIKTKKLGKGEYAIVSAGGTFSSNNGKESLTYTASISPLGPFVNGIQVAEEPVPIMLEKNGGVSIVNKSVNDSPLMGLKGVTLKLPNN